MQIKIRYPPKKTFELQIKKITNFKTFKQIPLWHVEEEEQIGRAHAKEEQIEELQK